MVFIIFSFCNFKGVLTFQARTTKEAGKLQMKRASLVKAGLALAPDSFGLVLDGETGLSLPRSGPTNPQQLAEMVTRYQKSVSVISGHIKRLGNENERERQAKIYVLY